MSIDDTTIDLDQTFESEPDADLHANERENSGARNRLALQMLKQTRDSLTHVIHLLEEGDASRATRQMVHFVSSKQHLEQQIETETGSRVVEGVFDGQSMVGSDGVRYKISSNYASKSRLVEGDILKLTIKPDGTYLFKQIGPVDRRRLVGILSIDPSTNEHVVTVGDKGYKVLAASVSYFKGVTGDEVVVLLPKNGESAWGAVENIVSGQK